MKRAIAVVVGTILFGLMLTGCVTTQSGQSGQPKVTINTTDMGKIKSAIINEFKKLNYKVVSESDDIIKLEGRRLGYTGANLMHAIFKMENTGDSTAVLAQAFLKSDAGFGRQTYSEEITYSNSGAQLVQILKRVKAQVESK
ncbi:MAG: hypothetical protein PVG39_15795 [Desulfobacteraceae bacterium]|jgi:hypothetical protein